MRVREKVLVANSESGQWQSTGSCPRVMVLVSSDHKSLCNCDYCRAWVWLQINLKKTRPVSMVSQVCDLELYFWRHCAYNQINETLFIGITLMIYTPTDLSEGLYIFVKLISILLWQWINKLHVSDPRQNYSFSVQPTRTHMNQWMSGTWCRDVPHSDQ